MVLDLNPKPATLDPKPQTPTLKAQICLLKLKELDLDLG